MVRRVAVCATRHEAVTSVEFACRSSAGFCAYPGATPRRANEIFGRITVFEPTPPLCMGSSLNFHVCPPPPGALTSPTTV
jgi:hypothetical protein